MIQIKRNKPAGETERYGLKNISYNSEGLLFLIFEKDFKEEMFIGLNESETKELIKFVRKIDGKNN